MMTGLAPISGQAVVALYGFDRIRFINPVLLGDTITYTSRIAALEPKGDRRGIADLEFQICNQHQKVCVAGTIKLLLHKSTDS
jgi:acyl dehydratase